MTRVLGAAACVLAFAACVRPAEEAEARAPIQLAPCTVPGLGRPARCGTYEVWEDRGARTGRRIALQVTVVPAAREPHAPDPVFYFAGGPGSSATAAAPGMARFLRAVNRSRDLVFVDARGTGGSHPLRCATPDDAPLQRHFDEFLSDDYVRGCLARQDADVRFYTQPIAMDDIDDVRQALGYERINLFGSSGGTRQEQIYARRHPAAVRAMVLHGVQPMDAEMPLSFSRAMEQGMAALLDACRSDAGCRTAYPALAEDWERSKRRFDTGPVEAGVQHPRTQRRERVRITRGVYADGIRHMLYDLAGAWQLTGIIHAAAGGDFDPFARRELAQSIGFDNLLADGMFLSSTCAEDVRFIDEADIRRATEGTFLGDYRVRRQQAACRIWPRGEGIEADFQQPVHSPAPVLLLSGDADVATPPADAERVARALPNARHIIFPNQGHGFTNPGCAALLIASFIDAGGARALDTSCVATTRRPAFPAGGRPDLP